MEGLISTGLPCLVFLYRCRYRCIGASVERFGVSRMNDFCFKLAVVVVGADNFFKKMFGKKKKKCLYLESEQHHYNML